MKYKVEVVMPKTLTREELIIYAKRLEEQIIN